MSWRKYFQRSRRDRDLANELESYLLHEIDQNIAAGMAPAEARRRARRKLGNSTAIREKVYEMNTISWFESFWRDLCYGLRQLRLSPGFTAVAILSLALGIGANTAIFQLLDAVRLRSLPVPHPQELAEIRVEGGYPMMGVRTGYYAELTLPIWQEIRDRKPAAFSEVFLWTQAGGRVGEGNDAHQVDGMLVSGNFFSVLGVPAWRGRTLTPEDESPSCPSSTTVVSYSYWRDRLGGQEVDDIPLLSLNGQPHRVVGVMPPEFFGLIVGDSFEVIIPFCSPSEVRRDLFQYSVMGRLAPGVSIQSASDELKTLSPGIFEATEITGYNEDYTGRYRSLRLEAVSASAGVSALRQTYDSSLWLLLGITGLVLLIACANLANLMLARAGSREREVAVRRALGASRLRLLRQLLTESALLAGAGAIAGVAVARLLSQALVASLSTESSTVNLAIETDWKVLSFAAVVACVTCVVFGAMPALKASRTQPQAAMSGGGRTLTAGREHFSVQRLMVVAQVAVSLVLLVGALLFVRSFRNLTTFDAGMRQEGVIVAFFGFQGSNVPQDQWLAHKRLLTDEVRAIPGVANAATTTNIPLVGGSWNHNVHSGGGEGGVMFTWVGPGYFDAMGIPILRGRGIEDSDTGESPRVVVVNEAFVQSFLGDAQPIGQTLRTDAEPGFPETVYEIVGIMPNTRYDNLRGGMPPMAFAPDLQVPNSGGPFAQMMIHVAGPSTLEAIRRTFAQTHPEIRIDSFDFQTRIRDGLTRERLLAMLSGFFGLLAAVLTMVGLYGVISYITIRRRNEIGIRMALGAMRMQIVHMVLWDGARLLAVGVLIGAALSLLAGRAADALLFGLTPHDPLTIAASCLLLIAVAVGAGLLPAWRASRLDPMSALRQD